MHGTAEKPAEDERYLVCTRRTHPSAYQHFFGGISHLDAETSNAATRALHSAWAQARTLVRKAS